MNLTATLQLDSAQFKAALAAVQSQLAGALSALSGFAAAETAAGTAGHAGAAGIAAQAAAASAAGSAAVAASAALSAFSGASGATAAAVGAATAAVIGLTAAEGAAAPAAAGAAAAASAQSAALALLTTRATAAAGAVAALRAASSVAGAPLALPSGFLPRYHGGAAPDLPGDGAFSPGAAAAVGAASAGLGGSMFRFLAPAGAAVGGLLGFAAAVKTVRSAVAEAARMEDFETTFVTLLGSIEAAKSRMAELAKFADTTPFELPEVAQASRVLETLTKGAISTGEGLRMVGDVAAATSQPFGDIAVQIGRLYDGLQSGRPVGEALMRLQELGIVGGSARDSIEKMQAAGRKGPEVWAIAAAAFARYSGEMERRAETFTGRLSTMWDGLKAVLRDFGRPIADALKPLLVDFTGYLASIKPIMQEVGEVVATAIRSVHQAFATGRLGELAGSMLKLGFSEAINWLGKALPAAFTANLKMLSSSDYWSGMGNAIVAALEGVGVALLGALSKPIALINASVDTALQHLVAAMRTAFAYTPVGYTLEKAGVDVRGPEAKSFEQNYDARYAEVQGYLDAAVEDAGKNARRAAEKFQRVGSKYVDDFQTEMAKGRNVINTEPLREETRRLVDSLAGAMKVVTEDVKAATRTLEAAGVHKALNPPQYFGPAFRRTTEEPDTVPSRNIPETPLAPLAPPTPLYDYDGSLLLPRFDVGASGSALGEKLRDALDGVVKHIGELVAPVLSQSTHGLSGALKGAAASARPSIPAPSLAQIADNSALVGYARQTADYTKRCVDLLDQLVAKSANPSEVAWG